MTTNETTDRTSEIQHVIRETAVVQLAALNAGIEFWSGWVDSATKYTRLLARELLGSEERPEQRDLFGRLADLNRQYLREMTELPDRAARRFDEDVAELWSSGPESGNRTAPRTRRARAKE